MSYEPNKELIAGLKVALDEIKELYEYGGRLPDAINSLTQMLAACETLLTPHPSTWPEGTTFVDGDGGTFKVVSVKRYGSKGTVFTWADCISGGASAYTYLTNEALANCTDITFPDGRILHPSKK